MTISYFFSEVNLVVKINDKVEGDITDISAAFSNDFDDTSRSRPKIEFINNFLLPHERFFFSSRHSFTVCVKEFTYQNLFAHRLFYWKVFHKRIPWYKTFSFSINKFEFYMTSSFIFLDTYEIVFFLFWSF